MFFKKFLRKFYKFCIKNGQKCFFFAKLHTCPSIVDVFLFYFFSESPKNLLQDLGIRVFNFIIFGTQFLNLNITSIFHLIYLKNTFADSTK